MSVYSDNNWEGIRRVSYGVGDDEIYFVPVCEKCGRFVKARATVRRDQDGPTLGPTADCKKCGPTTMPFDGYAGDHWTEPRGAA